MTIENTLSHLHAILMLIKWGNKSYIVNNKECLSTNLAKKVYLNIVLHKVHYSALRKWDMVRSSLLWVIDFVQSLSFTEK